MFLCIYSPYAKTLFVVQLGLMHVRREWKHTFELIHISVHFLLSYPHSPSFSSSKLPTHPGLALLYTSPLSSSFPLPFLLQHPEEDRGQRQEWHRQTQQQEEAVRATPTSVLSANGVSGLLCWQKNASKVQASCPPSPSPAMTAAPFSPPPSVPSGFFGVAGAALRQTARDAQRVTPTSAGEEPSEDELKERQALDEKRSQMGSIKSAFGSDASLVSSKDDGSQQDGENPEMQPRLDDSKARRILGLAQANISPESSPKGRQTQGLERVGATPLSPIAEPSSPAAGRAEDTRALPSPDSPFLASEADSVRSRSIGLFRRNIPRLASSRNLLTTFSRKTNKGKPENEDNEDDDDNNNNPPTQLTPSTPTTPFTPPISVAKKLPIYPPGTAHALITWHTVLHNIYTVHKPTDSQLKSNASLTYKPTRPTAKPLVSISFNTITPSLTAQGPVFHINTNDIARILYVETDTFNLSQNKQKTREGRWAFVLLKYAASTAAAAATTSSPPPSSSTNVATAAINPAPLNLPKEIEQTRTNTTPWILIAWPVSAVSKTTHAQKSISPDTPNISSPLPRSALPRSPLPRSPLANLAMSSYDSTTADESAPATTTTTTTTIHRTTVFFGTPGSLPLVESHGINADALAAFVEAFGLGNGKVVLDAEME
ncbi:unnamed protein product [Periconia digitata]|uniref:Uncharacterized protein n=1 Tax=Periconia digitata TaxID=1303443 RepID=A0A9W4U7Q3_9PLEO|nr:unnamed protein product [Periconia digitata]